MRADYETTVEWLWQTNVQWHNLELSVQEEKDTVRWLREDLNAKERKTEQLYNDLEQAEKEKQAQLAVIRELEIKVQNMGIEGENMKEQKNSQIALLEQSLKTEKAARETWMGRFLEEQKL